MASLIKKFHCLYVREALFCHLQITVSHFILKRVTFVLHPFFLFKVKQRVIFTLQHGSLQNGWLTGRRLGYLATLKCFFWEKRPAGGDASQYISHFFLIMCLRSPEPLTAECICLLLLSSLSASWSVRRRPLCWILTLTCPPKPERRRMDTDYIHL